MTTKKERFENMGQKEMLAKRNELVKEMLKARLSLDVSAVQAEGGIQGLRKDLKTLGRKLASTEKRGSK